MSANTKALGLGDTISYKGVEYPLSPMTLEQMTIFEAWVEEQMWKAHRRTRNILDVDEYDRNATQLRKECGMGVYGYPRPEWWQAITSFSGMKYAVWLVLKDNYKEITQEVADEMVNLRYDHIIKLFVEANDPSDPTDAKPDQSA